MPNLSKLAALSALLFLSIVADAGAQAPLQLSTNKRHVVWASDVVERWLANANAKTPRRHRDT